MKKIKPINYRLLRQSLKPSNLRFKTTEELEPLTKFIGQNRALEALNFAINVTHQGYNIYAMGPSGIGKKSFIELLVNNQAKQLQTPSDWCYIYNFSMPERPLALELPQGMGIELQQDMKSLMGEISVNIISVFESDEFRFEMKKIADTYEQKRKQNRKLKIKLDKTPQLYKEQHKKEKEFQLTTIRIHIEPSLNKIKKKYADYPTVIDYLNAVQNDIIENFSDLIYQDEKTNLFIFTTENSVLIKYSINLLVDNNQLKGAPVVFEEAPSYSSLICRVEHTSQLGTPVTNFTLIKPGSLHKANGGFLIIESRKLKKNKDTWEALKNALYTNKISIKPIEHDSDTVRPVSLEPSPIPLKVKVILMGDRNTYYMWCQKDADFLELFKIPVDFDEEILRNKENISLYARLIGTIVHNEKLLPFHASAVAAIIDFSSRLAEDSEKLSTHIREIQDLAVQSHYLALHKNKKIVTDNDVKNAINAQIHRMNRSRDLYYDDIYRDFIFIKTKGKSLGQANCLSVRLVGSFSYGHPTRVSARVSAGVKTKQGRIIDIQREIKLAGPMHSKAGLIISSFLASRFNENIPFSLYASISFEQVYVWTDGDSASVAELCALLSALSGVPLLQSLAVTGSIDQYGAVQAIGGVNEKIEGFFDVCKARGLTGQQGVIIPTVNQKNLMLREDIQIAAKKKQFSIYTIDTIDEAISILTGMQAGKRDRLGKFPKDSIYFKIENRLKSFAKLKK